MDNAPTRQVEHAPYNWITTTIFTLTPLVALTVVPWYGIVHGYNTASWIFFALFLVCTGVGITGGYHRMWAHRAYNAHWSVRLFYMLFGAMALQQTILIWASQHRVHHLNVDDVDIDPYSAKRGFWFRTSAGSCGTTRAAKSISRTCATCSATRSSRSSTSTTCRSRSR
jgi:stearoyl-CoA desaturase (delta-9 desaturase)